MLTKARDELGGKRWVCRFKSTNGLYMMVYVGVCPMMVPIGLV